MPNLVKWGTPTSRLTITTEIASLASGARSNQSGSAVANATNKDEFMWVKLSFTPGAAPAAGAQAIIYALPSHDGSTYPEGSSTVDPGAPAILCVIPITVSNNAKSPPLQGPFRINPFDYKFIVENSIGQSWTSGQLIIYTGNEEIQ